MKQMFTLAAAAAAVSLLAGCNGEKPAEQKAAPAAEAAAVIIYSNADEEAQKAMKNALDANGMKGLYKIQGLAPPNSAASSPPKARILKPTW